MLLLELLTVHSTGCSLDYSAVPKDGDSRKGYGPSIWLSLWLCLRTTIAAYAVQTDGDLAGEDFHEHTATKE